MAPNRISPELLREAVEAYRQHGSATAAAKAIGIPRTTLISRLEAAERDLGLTREVNVDASKERKAKKDLEQLVEQQAKFIEDLTNAKFDIPAAAKPKQLKGAYNRVIVPDTHGAKADREALAAFLRDLELLAPREVVLLGDHLDCGGFLAQHHTLGYVAECAYTWADDVTAANAFLDAVQAAAPKASITYLEGNHEARIAKWCVTQALRSETDAAFLLSMLAPEVVLSLEKRGIRFASLRGHHDGLRIRGTVKLGKCYFTHGVRTGVYATRQTLKDFGCNVVHGHTHTAAFASDVTVKEGLVGAWCPGCLSELQPYWRHGSVTNWSHGYGWQLVNGDQDFLHVNVPIIDSRSYLMQIRELVKQ